MPALTRGPLPASVYWRRRLVVLTVALLLLWTALHVFGGGGGGTPKADSAADLTGASTSPSPTARPSGKTSPTASNSASASGSASGSPSADAPASTSSAPVVSETPSPTVLPSPSGACPASDVSVTPSVTGATAGTSVAIVLSLRTFSTPACTWHVIHKTMQVKVTTAGGADVWSTVQCPAAMPTSDVVVYKDTATPITVTWSGRRADSDAADK